MFKLRPVSAGHSICVILFAACSRGKAGAEFHLNILIKYWKNVSHLTCFHPQYIYCMYYSVVPRFCWGRGGGGGLNLLPNFTTSRVYSHLTCFHPQSNYCMCYPIVPPSSCPPLSKAYLHRSLLMSQYSTISNSSIVFWEIKSLLRKFHRWDAKDEEFISDLFYILLISFQYQFQQ